MCVCTSMYVAFVYEHIHADVSDHLRCWFLIYSKARTSSAAATVLNTPGRQAGLPASRDRPSHLDSALRVLGTQTQVHASAWQSLTLAKIV